MRDLQGLLGVGPFRLERARFAPRSPPLRGFGAARRASLYILGRVEDAVQEHASFPDCWIGTWRSLVIFLHNKAPSVEEYNTAVVCQRAMASKHPEGFVVLTVLSEQDRRVRGVDEELRRRIADSGREFWRSRLALVRVVLGTGFFAMLARGVVRGLSVLQQNAMQEKTMSTVSEAAGFLAPLMSGAERAVSAVEIERAVDQAYTLWKARA